MICPKDGTEMRPTYEPYEHRCPKCGYWFDDWTGKEINPNEAAEKYGKHLENQGLAKKVNDIRRIIEMNEIVYIDTTTDDEWVWFRFFNDENDHEPYQIKKIARDTVWNMDWSLAALLIMNAPSEPIAKPVEVINPLPFDE